MKYNNDGYLHHYVVLYIFVLDFTNINMVSLTTEISNWHGMSDRAILELLGTFIRNTRLGRNKTQQEVAEAAGINRSTLVQMEKGNGGTLISFIQVLRALGQLQTLEIFEAKEVISPLLLAKMEKQKRIRASRKAASTNKRKSTW